MTWPNSKTAAQPAINPWSTSTHQFACWYDLAGELYIGRITRGTHRWGVDHTQYKFGGTPRTALALPAVDADEHKYPAVCIDGNGRIHVWANMHNNPMRYVRSNDPHGSNTWTSDSGWTEVASELPSVASRCTYPTPVKFPDESMFFYLRNGSAGVSGQYDSYLWRRTPTGTAWTDRTLVWQGLEVPNAGGAGVNGPDGNSAVTDARNWSVYPTNFLVESIWNVYPGRVHVCWCWRSDGPDGQSNVLPSYAYSDDKGVTWKAVDGTVLTLPITPLNNHACRIPLGSAFYTGIGRASNIVIAELDTTNHGFQVGDTLACYNNGTFNGTSFTVASIGNPNPTSIAWAQTGSNETGTSGAGNATGTVCKFRWFNWGSMAVDPMGRPHILVGVNPSQYIRYDGTAWQRTELANPIGGGGTGIVHQTTWGGCFWIGGHVWGLVNSWGSLDSGASPRVRLIRITGSNPQPKITMSGDVGSSSWNPGHDMEAYRLFGDVETIAPEGDYIRIFTYKRGTRRVLAG